MPIIYSSSLLGDELLYKLLNTWNSMRHRQSWITEFLECSILVFSVWASCYCNVSSLTWLIIGEASYCTVLLWRTDNHPKVYPRYIYIYICICGYIRYISTAYILMSELVFVLSIICMKRTTEVNSGCCLSSDSGPTIKFSTTSEWTKCLFFRMPTWFFWVIHWKLSKYHLSEMICSVLLFWEPFWILVDEEQILPWGDFIHKCTPYQC